MVKVQQVVQLQHSPRTALSPVWMGLNWTTTTNGVDMRFPSNDDANQLH